MLYAFPERGMRISLTGCVSIFVWSPKYFVFLQRARNSKNVSPGMMDRLPAFQI